MRIVRALDCAGEDVERGRVFVWRNWSGLQLVIPRIRQDNRAVTWDRGIRDNLTKGSEGEIEFLGDRLEELRIQIDHFGDRAEKPR